MPKLCGFHVSNYHNRVRLALLEKGIACDEDSTAFPSQKEEFVARSPLGKVPFLEVSGTVVTESQVICEYLEDAYPQVKPYLKMLGERPHFRRVNADRKAAAEAMVSRNKRT